MGRQQHMIQPSVPKSDLEQNWPEKRKISIDSTYIDSNLTDWTGVMTETTIPSDALNSSATNPAKSDGSDIRFSTDETGWIQVGRDVRRFNQASGGVGSGASGEIAVMFPDVGATSGGDLYIWWGNSNASEPNASDANGQYNAYDSNTVGVWTFNETSGNLIDRTSNGNDGNEMNQTSRGVSGVIGSAYSFDGSSGTYVGVPYDNSWDLLTYTLSAWVKSDNTDFERIVSTYHYPNMPYELRHGNSYDVANYDGSTVQKVVTTTPVSTGVWSYVVGTKQNNSNMEIFFNGTGEDTNTDNLGDIRVGSGRLAFGCNANNTSSANFTGDLSQVVLHNVVRSDAWIKADYNCIENEGSFYSTGLP